MNATPDSPRSPRARSRATDRTPASIAEPLAVVPVGRVLRAHGVHGALVVRAFGDTLASLRRGERIWARARDSRVTERSLTVEAVRPTHADLCLVELDPVHTREDGQALNGLELCVPRERLPQLAADEYYRADLLGLAVHSPAGDRLGEIVGFLDLPQHDVLVVRGEAGELLLPMAEGTIHEIDLASRRVVATPFLDEARPTPRVRARRPDRQQRAAGTSGEPKRASAPR